MLPRQPLYNASLADATYINNLQTSNTVGWTNDSCVEVVIPISCYIVYVILFLQPFPLCSAYFDLLAFVSTPGTVSHPCLPESHMNSCLSLLLPIRSLFLSYSKFLGVITKSTSYDTHIMTQNPMTILRLIGISLLLIPRDFRCFLEANSRQSC